MHYGLDEGVGFEQGRVRTIPGTTRRWVKGISRGIAKLKSMCYRVRATVIIDMFRTILHVCSYIQNYHIAGVVHFLMEQLCKTSNKHSLLCSLKPPGHTSALYPCEDGYREE